MGENNSMKEYRPRRCDYCAATNGYHSATNGY